MYFWYRLRKPAFSGGNTFFTADFQGVSGFLLSPSSSGCEVAGFSGQNAVDGITVFGELAGQCVFYIERHNLMTDICIIGGGASGMTAAICAKESNPALDIIIFEKKRIRRERKILASGNGKCNLSNQACPGVETTLEFFRHLGILTRTDAEGRLYPYTEEARAVRDALDTRLRSLGGKKQRRWLKFRLWRKTGDGTFTVELGNKSITAGKVLIACGGKAGSAFGTTGDGFRFARRFGHKVNKPVPVLTAVNLKEDLKQLSGIRVKGKVTLTYLEKPIFSETGEIQFTESGISGICIFNLSRYLMIPEGENF